MLSATLELIRGGRLKKGDVLTTAQLAGVMAAKRTARLIPLCHPLSLNQIDVLLEADEELPGIGSPRPSGAHRQDRSGDGGADRSLCGGLDGV